MPGQTLPAGTPAGGVAPNSVPPLAGPEGDRAWMYGPHLGWAAPFAVLTTANKQPELTIRYFDEYFHKLCNDPFKNSYCNKIIFNSEDSPF